MIPANDSPRGGVKRFIRAWRTLVAMRAMEKAELYLEKMGLPLLAQEQRLLLLKIPIPEKNLKNAIKAKGQDAHD